jgi:hypothetical protein
MKKFVSNWGEQPEMRIYSASGALRGGSLLSKGDR